MHRIISLLPFKLDIALFSLDADNLLFKFSNPFQNVRYITILPVQWHALIFAAFASLIAPFGGFFASGVKRAFDIKDFSDSIPGHGGLTDRMDCQFIMGVFANIYYSSFIKSPLGVTAAGVLEYAVANLSFDDLKQVYSDLGEYLLAQGMN